MVMVWLPEFPPIPATMGMSAASATSFSIECSKAPITREATNAVTRLIASHDQRFLTLAQTEEKTSSSSRNPACVRSSFSLLLRMKSTTLSTVTRPTSLPCSSTTGAETRSYRSKALAASCALSPDWSVTTSLIITFATLCSSSETISLESGSTPFKRSSLSTTKI